MQQIIEGVKKRSLLPTQPTRGSFFFCGRLKDTFTLSRFANSFSCCLSGILLKVDLFVVYLISIIMHYKRNLHQGLINHKALRVRFKFVAYLELAPLLAKTLLMFLVYFKIPTL